MILREIYLENFRQYSEPTLIRFDRPTPERPLVLIGGVNNTGKTTLLDGLVLALFGDDGAIRMDRNPMRFRDIHETRRNRGEMTVTLKVAFDEGNHLVEVQRWWRVPGRMALPAHEDVQFEKGVALTRDGRPDPEITSIEEIDAYLREIIPVEVAPFFFFDGEKIRDFSRDMERRKRLDDALRDILGIELVNRLGNDVATQRAQWLKEIGNESAEVKAAEKGVERLKLDRRVQEIEREIGDQRLRLEQIRHDEAGLLARQRELHRLIDPLAAVDRQRLEEERKRLDLEVRTLIEGEQNYLDAVFPLALNRDLAAATVEQAHRELRGGRTREARERLIQFLNDGSCFCGVHPLPVAAEQIAERILSALAEARDSAAFASRIVDAPPGEIEALEKLLPDLFGSGVHARQRLEAQRTLEDQLATVEAELARSSPNPRMADELAEIQGKLQELARTQSTIEQQLNAQRVELDGSEQQRQMLAAEQLALQARTAMEKRYNALVQLCLRVERVSRRYADRLRTQKLSGLQEDALNIFQGMINRPGLYTTLNLDSETLEVTLRTADGNMRRAEQLSDGERTILAYAIIGALARAADRELPVIIDAPIGRLDVNHKRHVLEQYIVESSSQVILLTTPSEISVERELPVVEGRIMNRFTLYRRAQNVTAVQENLYQPTEGVHRSGLSNAH